MPGINKRSTDPRVNQKKMTRYGTTEEQEIRDSNKLMKPMLDARKAYQKKKK